MPDQIYPVPAEWASAPMSMPNDMTRCMPSRLPTPKPSGAARRGRIDWIKPFTKVEIHQFRRGRFRHQMVRRRRAQRLGQLPRPPSGRRAAIRSRSSGKATIPPTAATHHLSRAARRSLPLRQCAEGAGRAKGRPGHHLPADDPRGGRRHARLRADRRDPFDRVRRLLARGAGRPHPGLRFAAGHHRRRGAARRQAGAAEGQCRCRRWPHCTSVSSVIVVRRTGGDVAMQEGRDHWYHDLRDTVAADCAPEPMGAEDPLFILYTSGSTGKPKGVLHTTGGYLVWAAMTHQYVFDYRPGRDLLVHRRCRLGHRAQLCRLWPAGQRRDHADVRRRAQLSRFQPLLADRRQASGQHLLHRAHRAARADARGRRLGEADRRASRCACSAPSASRSIPRPGNGITEVVGEQPLPDRRYLVADRDRRRR